MSESIEADMRIGFVSTRMAGTDGVSLETRKWAAIFRRLGSVVVPNIFDFSQTAPGITHRNADLRRALPLNDQHLLILQPTRVVRRKGIELALSLVCQLRRWPNRRRLLNKEPVLTISHHASDEDWGYLEELRALARRWRAPLYYAAAHGGAQLSIGP